MIFQVTGLSRSATAWMATFLNLHPGCYCHHDLAAETDNWLEESEELTSFWEYVGEVSTYGWMKKATRTGGPKVFIERDPDDVFLSLWKVTGEKPVLSDVMHQYKMAKLWAEGNDALIIPFKELHTIPRLREIWEYIFGRPHSFPLPKARLLIKMNIQRVHAAEMVDNPEQAHQRLFV